MERRQPWLKWYPADWRADPALRMCSLAARGLWADMIGLMHEAEPYGHLLVAGRAPTTQQLAALVGVDARSAASALAELEAAGVFSRDDQGRIYSRRMLRDKAKADRDRQNGKGGGNPRLREADKPGVNPPDKAEGAGGDKAQKPEARDTSSLRSDGASAAPPPAAAPPQPIDPRAEVFGAGVARLRRLTGKSDPQCRAMIGRWLRDLGDDCPGLSRVLFEAEDARPADPCAWIEAAIRARRGLRTPPARAAPERRGRGVAEAVRRMAERGELDLGHPGDAQEVQAEIVQ